MCVCVRERDRDRDRQTDRQTDRQIETETEPRQKSNASRYRAMKTVLSEIRESLWPYAGRNPLLDSGLPSVYQGCHLVPSFSSALLTSSLKLRDAMVLAPLVSMRIAMYAPS